MVKEALVVRRDVLFKEKYFQGFSAIDEHDFIQIILSQHTYHPRGDELENDAGLQQIIPYIWIINPKAKQIFAYKRSAGNNYAEKRLHNKLSCGIGGHIDKEDSEDPIKNAMMRELKEEILMENYPMPKIIGYLNDDSDSVGQVHFGIVAIAETTEEVKKGDDEMLSGRFYNIDELEKEFTSKENDVEAWTQMSWPFVKEYLMSKG